MANYPTAWSSLPAASRTTSKTIIKGTVTTALETALIAGIAAVVALKASKDTLTKNGWNGILAASVVYFTGSLMQSGKVTKDTTFKAVSTYSYRQIADPIISNVTGTVSNNYLEVRIVVNTYAGSNLMDTQTKYEKTSTVAIYH